MSIAVAATELMVCGDENGLEFDEDVASRLIRRHGIPGAHAHVVSASQLREYVAFALGRLIDFDDASRLLMRSGNDLDVAITGIRLRAAEGRVPVRLASAREAVALAAELGHEMSLTAAVEYAAQGGTDLLSRLRDAAQLRDVASGLGFVVDERFDAAARLRVTGGDVDIAIARLEEQAVRRIHRIEQFCPLHRRGLSRGVGQHGRIDAAARCGCSGCIDRLIELLLSSTRAIVNRDGRMIVGDEGRDAAEQEAVEVLLKATETWKGECPFKSFYCENLSRHFASRANALRAQKRGGGVRPQSLDEPVAVLDDSGFTLHDVLPDRTIDPLDYVLLKERLLLARVERRMAARVVWNTYEGKARTRSAGAAGPRGSVSR